MGDATGYSKKIIICLKTLLIVITVGIKTDEST